MMTARGWLLGCGLTAVLTVFAQGADIQWVPVSATGDYTIDGNTITLVGGDQLVTLEIRLSGWDPEMDGPNLGAYQGTINASGYDNGNGDPLVPDGWPSSPGDGAYIDSGRTDYTFNGVTSIPVVATVTLDYEYGAVVMGSGKADGGLEYYSGTLVIYVPAGAAGVYTVDFVESDSFTFIRDEIGYLIEPLIKTSATIAIACASNEDCDDGNACTDDVCLPSQTCENTINYDDEVYCCNPDTGMLTTIDDGEECTEDVCDPDTGAVTHPALPSGTACGDSTESECDHADTCDGAGNCDENLEDYGEPCGDPTVNECNGADICDGAGLCMDNLIAAGEPCGSSEDTDCDNPDTCDGAGSCQDNFEINGTECDDGEYCNVDEACLDGVCSGGVDRDCTDGLPCTTDTCNEVDDICESTLDAGYCLIDDTCRATNDLNPSDDCQECNPGLSTEDWSQRPTGSLCNDGDPCTDDDACDEYGVCVGIYNPECNDNCENAIPAVEGSMTSQNASAGEDSVEASCQPDSNHDIWFVYIASCSGDVFISTTGTSMAPSNDPVLSVYDECYGAEIACDDDSGIDLQAALTLTTVAGEDYFIRVAGFEENVGDVVLNVDTVNDCVIGTVCYADGDRNPGNDCEMCIPELSTFTWSDAPEGTSCGNPVPDDPDCDAPDACDGAGSCETNYKPDGIACTDEGNECTFDECDSGLCAHPPRPELTPCGDPSDSECDHPDTCDAVGVCQSRFEAYGTACGDPYEDQCDLHDICDGAGLCDVNYEINGTECDDEDICTGDDACLDGECVGTAIPVEPLMVTEGPKAFTVTPQPMGSVAPVALHVTSPTWGCLDKFIDVDGSLVDTPVIRLPSEWGNTILRDVNIVPSSTYEVVAECGAYASPAASGTTCLWAMSTATTR